MSSARIAPISRSEAAGVARAEYDALLAMLRGLDAADWQRPTECPPWTVHDMVAHVTGAAEEAVRVRVLMRHLLRARRHDGPMVDTMNAQQVAERSDRSPAELLEELAALATRAPRARARVPGLVRRRPLPDPAALPEDTMGHLLDVIYTRDVWMHRIDLSRATGCPLPQSGAEDVVVSQVVRDLQRAWRGADLVLTLTGRITGTWQLGAAPVGEARLDAVAACRLWSGRSDETQPIHDGPTPDLVNELRSVRLLF